MLSSKVNDFGSVSPDCFPMSVTLTRCYSSSRSMLLPTGPPPWDTHNSVVYSIARSCKIRVKTSKTLGSVWFKLYLNHNGPKHVHVYYFPSSGNHLVVMCRTTGEPLHSCDKWIKNKRIKTNCVWTEIILIWFVPAGIPYANSCFKWDKCDDSSVEIMQNALLHTLCCCIWGGKWVSTCSCIFIEWVKR